MSQSYKREAIHGVAWNSVAKIASSLLSVVQLAVVARFIDKADFGVMSLVHVTLGLVSMFSDLGMYAAMMHKQDTTEDQYNSLYWMNWAINITLFGILCAVAFPVAKFYNEPRLAGLTILTGTQLLLQPFGKIFYTIKQKNLEFGFISLVSILVTTLTFFITVVMCVLGAGIYSLIVPSLISQMVNAIILIVAGRKQFHVRFHFKFSEIKDYVKIGLYDTGAQLMDYLSYKIDVLLVGKFFGTETLGLYNMGKEMALKTMKLIGPIINGVATPILSKLQKDLESIKTNYIRILNVISFINFPILLALFVFATPVVRLLLSSKYIDAAPFLRILCFWGIFASTGNPAGNLVVAKGRTDLSFRWTVVRFACAPLAVFIASKFSPIAIAYSQVALQCVFFFIYWRILIYPLSEITLKEYIGAFANGFLCAAIASGVSLVWRYIGQMSAWFSGNPWIDLIGGCVIFGVVYLLSSFFLNKKTLDFFKSLIPIEKIKAIFQS